MGRKRRRNVEIEEPEELEVDNGKIIELMRQSSLCYSCRKSIKEEK